MTPCPRSRRRLLRAAGAGVALVLPLLARPARAATAATERRLVLAHTHTLERIDLVYANGEGYRPEALAQLDRFLRDHYSGEVGHIDAPLFDQLHRVRRALGVRDDAAPFEIISGYRAPATNARLRATRGGGVATHSLHMEGRALDVRLPGVPLAELRDAALALSAGGVGFYEREQFVHVDTGRVRRW